MFGISGEHVLVLAIVLLIFGPRRLPELGNTLGKAVRNFKDAIDGVKEAKFERIQETPPSSLSVTLPPASESQTDAPVTAGVEAASATKEPAPVEKS